MINTNRLLKQLRLAQDVKMLIFWTLFQLFTVNVSNNRIYSSQVWRAVGHLCIFNLVLFFMRKITLLLLHVAKKLSSNDFWFFRRLVDAILSPDTNFD